MASSALNEIDANELWDKIYVNYEYIDENLEDCKRILKNKLIVYGEGALKDAAKILNIECSLDSDKESIVDDIITHKDIKILISLSKFINKKKNIINDIYNIILEEGINGYDSHEFIKLMHMYYLDYKYILYVYTMYKWQSKSSGINYEFKKSLKQQDIDTLFNEKSTDLLKYLDGNVRKTDYNYKIHSSCILNNNEYIFLIYKFLNDQKIPGFDETKRLKSVAQVMFSINVDKKLIQIKSNTLGDGQNLKKSLEKILDGELLDYKSEIYDEYNLDKLISVFNDNVNYDDKKSYESECIITRLKVSNSNLKNSPIINIESEGRDIWESVVDGFDKNILNLHSLSDIKLLTMKTDKYLKDIKLISFGDGNVKFKLDDSGLNEHMKSCFEKSFKCKFGIPLNTPIKDKFEIADIDRINYILRQKFKDQIYDSYLNLLEGLRAQKIVEVKEERSYLCSCGCNWSEDEYESNNKICAECDGENIKLVKEETLSVDNKKITKMCKEIFVTYLKSIGGSGKIKSHEMTVNKKKYNTHRFKINEKTYQFIITDKMFSSKVMKVLKNHLIPTIIIYYSHERNYLEMNIPQYMESIDFSCLYFYKENPSKMNEIIDKMISQLDNNIYSHIILASRNACDSLNEIKGKTEEIDLKKYNEDDLEDDVFAILKSMIRNSEKWGNEFKGKDVPEGLFELKYTDSKSKFNNTKQYIFSYDCKLTTKKEGYDLGMGEKRKAYDYIERLNKLRDISMYTTSKEVTSHIFICNKFKEDQIEQMKDYFFKKSGTNSVTNPMFLDIKHLVKLHSFYMKNKPYIDLLNNVTYEELYKLFTVEDNFIKEKNVDEFIDELSYHIEHEKKTQASMSNISKNILS